MANNKARVESLLAARWESAKQIAPLSTLDTQAWKVGQWALYKVAHRKDPVAFERISVIAEDSCGTWIEWVQEFERVRTKWLLCVRLAPNPTNNWDVTKNRIQIGIRKINDEQPRFFDFRDGRNEDAKRDMTNDIRRLFLLVRQTIPDNAREDVGVPAGHFIDAVRERAGSLEIWSHPAVPFGGVVKIREWAKGEEVLVACGSSGANTDTPAITTLLTRALQPPRVIPPLFSSLAVGTGQLTGHGAAESGAGVAFLLESGLRIKRRIDLVVDLAVTSDVAYSPDPSMTLRSTFALLGVRWSPFRQPPAFERHRYDFSALHLQTGLGYSELNRTSMGEFNTIGRGIAASAIVGWLPIQGRDWSFGLELADRVALYNSGEGVRHNLFIFAVVQLHWGSCNSCTDGDLTF